MSGSRRRTGGQGLGWLLAALLSSCATASEAALLSPGAGAAGERSEAERSGSTHAQAAPWAGPLRGSLESPAVHPGRDESLEERRLRELLGSFEVDGFGSSGEASLEALVRSLSAHSKLPMAVHPEAEEASRSHGARFAVDGSARRTLRTLLDLLAEQAGPEVEWVVRYGSVLFTTRARALGEVYGVRYDVSDLLAPGAATERDAWTSAGLLVLLKELAGRGSWSAQGVALEAVEGSIVVKQTRSVHARLRAVLEELRATP